ncbi:uncharacterized protein C2845_PM15G02870 [Panicum miliaceum]|uniref:F-box protein n=1 Tax=Panicum miliaceum TaxID=4540 RepID=A0A3L6Q959_PANMI|nr:uncharacterized protein C2845_PM15G02870 [Panicum miliaceum]
MAADKRPATAAPYLPAELIPDIARHLMTLQDFFALRAACCSFRAALPPSRAVLASQPPHLLVPHHASYPRLLALVHLPRRRLLRFRAPTPPFPSTVVASDGARVVTLDHFARELSVIHLISGERVRIPDAPFLFSRGVLYALLNMCQLAVAELKDNKVELKLLGGEVSDHVRNAWMESKDFTLGECGGKPLLIFRVSVKPEYKVFRWELGSKGG